MCTLQQAWQQGSARICSFCEFPMDCNTARADREIECARQVQKSRHAEFKSRSRKAGQGAPSGPPASWGSVSGSAAAKRYDVFDRHVAAAVRMQTSGHAEFAHQCGSGGRAHGESVSRAAHSVAASSAGDRFWTADSFWLNATGHAQPDSYEVSLDDILQGDIQSLFIATFWFSDEWVQTTLRKIKKVVVMHGMDNITRTTRERGGHELCKYGMKPSARTGTHHTKMFIAVYKDRCRVCIHTANHTRSCWQRRLQGIWVQDFRIAGASRPSQFQADLIDYLRQYQVTREESHGDVQLFVDALSACDMTTATVQLVASVPGHRSGPDIIKYGHMRMGHVLRERDACAVVMAQSSSTTAKSPGWLEQFNVSMNSGETRVVWPTAGFIARCEGGNPPLYMSPDVAGRVETCPKTSLHVWQESAAHQSRHGSSPLPPHIKTYCGVDDPGSGRVNWLLLTSANLGPSAWGNVKGSTARATRSYYIGNWELGVLFGGGVVADANNRRKSDTVFPLPYLLTGRKYSAQDKPHTTRPE